MTTREEIDAYVAMTKNVDYDMVVYIYPVGHKQTLEDMVRETFLGMRYCDETAASYQTLVTAGYIDSLRVDGEKLWDTKEVYYAGFVADDWDIKLGEGCSPLQRLHEATLHSKPALNHLEALRAATTAEIEGEMGYLQHDGHTYKVFYISYVEEE